MQTPTFHRVLVGVDTDGLAAHAVQRGAELTRSQGARLDLVLAVEVPPAPWPGIGETEFVVLYPRLITAAREKAIRNLAEPMAAAGVALDLDEVLTSRPGHPAKVVLDTADELDADLVVLGPHAKRSLFDFGSTTRAVLARASVPLWLQSGPVGPIRRILVAVDLSEHSRLALDHAARFAAERNAELVLLHAWSPPDFAYAGTADAIVGPDYVIDHEREATRAELEAWARGLDQDATVHFLEGDATPVIVEESGDADLVVLGTHGRTGLSRFLLGSVAYGALRHCAQPVLVVPSPRRSWLFGDGAEQAEEQGVATAG